MVCLTNREVGRMNRARKNDVRYGVFRYFAMQEIDIVYISTEFRNKTFWLGAAHETQQQHD